jgi:hypothetical protein
MRYTTPDGIVQNGLLLLLSLALVSVSLSAVAGTAAAADLGTDTRQTDLTEDPATVENVTLGEDGINVSVEFNSTGSVRVMAVARSSSEQKINLSAGGWRNRTISPGDELYNRSITVTNSTAVSGDSTVWRTVEVMDQNPFEGRNDTLYSAEPADLNVSVIPETAAVENTSLTVKRSGGLLVGVIPDNNTTIFAVGGIGLLVLVLVLRD